MAGDRPVCLTVIGWGTIAVATLAIFSGVMSAIMFSTIEADFRSARGPQPRGFLFDNFALLSVLQALVGILLVFAGRGLLSLRRWASTVIEGVSWLALVYAVGFSAYFLFDFVGSSSESSRPIPTSFIVVMGMGVFFTLVFWGVPLGLTIWNLRSKRVRDVLS